MADKKGQTGVDGLEKIDSALDALVRFLKKKEPRINGVTVLSNKIKVEIEWENKRLRTLIRGSDQLKIEHFQRDIGSRNSKVNCLKDKLTNIKNTCRELFNSRITTISQCYSKLTELKHLNEHLTNFVKENEAKLSAMKSNINGIQSRVGTNKMTQKTELHHLQRGLKTMVFELTGQQTLNHEQEKKTEYKSNIISVIQHLEKEVECRDLQVKQLEEDLNKMKYAFNHLENKLKDKDSQLLKTCQQLNLTLYRLRTTETERSENLISLKRNNLGTSVDIESRDKRIEELEKMLDSVRTEMTTANELLRQKIKRQEEQLFYDFETIRSLKTENQENGHHISKLSFQLEQALNTDDDKNAEIRQLNISLKERHLEELLNSKMAELHQMNERIELLNKTMKKKDIQLYELREQLGVNLERLRETETEFEEIKTSLEQKIQNLLTDIKDRNQHMKDLEEKLINTRTETDAENDRLEQNLCAEETAKEKDNQISQLRYQQHHTFQKWQNREAELNENIMALERKNEQYEKKLKGTYFKMTQSNDQRDKLQASKDDLLGTIADLKKKNLYLEADCGLKVKQNDIITQLKHENKLLVNRLEEKDRAQREQLQLVDKKLHEREVEMNGIINSLKKQQEEDNHLNLELKDQLKQTLKKLNDKEANMIVINTALNRNLKGLEAEVDRRGQKIKHLDKLLDDRKTAVTKLTERNEFLEKKFKEMDDRLREQNEQLRIKTQHLQEEVKHRDRKVSELEDMLESKQEENRENKQYKDVKGKDQKLSELEKQLEQTLKKLHDTEIELDETKTRLSKAMGDRLTDNNPNITDLSDRNRPTKLAERCAELYDNQWTDAFDILDKDFDTEENVIETLLWILQDVMTFCERNAQRQMDEFGRELIFGDKHDGKKISADVCKLLKDCRKTVAPFAVGNVQKMYVSHLKRATDKTLRSALEVSSYTSECLDICWFMAIQDPPVAFAPLLKKGSSFDTDLYKPYTSSGAHIEYVVWPALLLHKGGPILSKGVAQGQGMKSKNSK